MTLNMSVVLETFGFNTVSGVAEDILDRLILKIKDADGDYDIYELLNDSLDEGFIFTADRWDVMKHYCTPETADFNIAYDMFINDLWHCINHGALNTDTL